MLTAIKIFCCYAREDEPLLQQLKKHLMPLQRQGFIYVWTDTNINARDDGKMGSFCRSIVFYILEWHDFYVLLSRKTHATG
ncbi:MAG: hypothetical protein H0U76_26690 [Ktedonobacteraceae bacterium]|nr:hypothetical protein [Ktedonobacteraceae bacterium]